MSLAFIYFVEFQNKKNKNKTRKKKVFLRIGVV
jgi:hypothetical protein